MSCLPEVCKVCQYIRCINYKGEDKMKKRGQLTEEVSNIWKEFQDDKEMQINKDDLRFFAHLDYVIKNEKRLKYDSLNEFDLDCLFFLYDQSYIIIKKIDDEIIYFKSALKIYLFLSSSILYFLTLSFNCSVFLKLFIIP